jgi:hypothetical protein
VGFDSIGALHLYVRHHGVPPSRGIFRLPAGYFNSVSNSRPYMLTFLLFALHYLALSGALTMCSVITPCWQELRGAENVTSRHCPCNRYSNYLSRPLMLNLPILIIILMLEHHSPTYSTSPLRQIGSTSTIESNIVSYRTTRGKTSQGDLTPIALTIRLWLGSTQTASSPELVSTVITRLPKCMTTEPYSSPRPPTVELSYRHRTSTI